jgi:uncharacterized C2H2 Zn-finger protein
MSKVHGEIKLMRDQIECKSCEMKFPFPNFYIQHHQNVHGNLPPDYDDKELFFCDQCPQVYISKQSLSDHVSYTHTGQKQKKKQEHKCPHCDKVFKMQQNYREHVKVKHEKSTPYKCDQCSRAYGTLIKLRNHKKLVHERGKCEECGKDICNSFILKRHKASVHGIKPSDAFQCELCPMFYDKKTYLNNHIAKHHSGT